jgi:hypothetical protein
MTDDQIRAVARRAVAKNPRYMTLRKIQIALWFLLMISVGAMAYVLGVELGLGFIVAAAAGLLLLVAWNLVWVNTALFRITKDEMRVD